MTPYFEIVCQIAIIMFLAYANACLTWFYTFAIGDPHHGEITKGRIFSGLGYWLSSKYYKLEQRENIRFSQTERDLKQKLTGQDLLDAITWLNVSRKKNIYKALGMCPICSNVWFGIISMGICFWWFSLPWILYLAGLVISNKFLRGFMTKGA